MRVIQGTTTNYGLTEKGREDIKEIVAENLEELSESDKIIASPYKRAQETAEIISEFTGKEIEVEPIIHEFKPGILGGKTHDENASLYPEYYKIWQERKDLDGIPGAETGKELQARALAFLMKYMDKDSYNDIELGIKTKIFDGLINVYYFSYYEDDEKEILFVYDIDKLNPMQ